VSLILDTHILLWLTEGNAELRAATRRLIDAATGVEEVGASAISFWEATLLSLKRRLALPRTIEAWRRVVVESGIVELPLTVDIAIEAARLPDGLHADPADRFIVATARIRGARLVSYDERLLAYAAAGHVDAVAS